MSGATISCPRCGAETAEGGVCTACLLRLVLAPEAGPGPAGDSIEERAYEEHGLIVLGPVGEGGVGLVYEAEQEPLGRLVALKVLREEHRGNAELRAKFDAEARIGARLQHPGVVPVYQSGMLGDRPFFTMRRVTGRSFAELLAEGPPRARALEVFRQVCQALAYAHDQGIIHRDLKPSNVMVGDFGEVVLLDWGMARDREAPDRESGAVMGTPAYMPPEQARGESPSLDERCDVFGLGAILCEVLTGVPPYVGDSTAEVRRRATAADLSDAFARLDAADADDGLKALARACLDPDPAGRPRHAGEVAAAIAAYEEGVRERLRAAEQARWQAEGRAIGERRRRRLVVALAVVCAGAAVWYLNARAVEARRELAREQAIDRAFEEAGRLRALGRLAEARASAGVARGMLADVPATLRERIAGRLADLETLDQLEDARFAPGQAGDPRIASARAEAYAAAFRRYGIDPGREDQAGLAEIVRRQPIREALLVALDDWARSLRDPARRGRLRALAAAADPDPDGLRARLRRALARRDRDALLGLARTPDLRHQPAAVLVSLGATLREAGATAEAVSVLRQAQESHPSDFLVNLELAAALAASNPPDVAGSEAFLTAALALSGRNPGVYFYLGQSLHEAGRLGPAVDAYRKATQLKPDYAEAYNNLGNALTALRRTDEAVAAFEKAIASRADYALAYFNLGYALENRKDDEAAVASYRRAIEAKPDYPEALCNLGLAEYRLGRFDAAVDDIERGLSLLPEDAPGRPTWTQVVGLARSLAALEPRLAAALRDGSPPSDPAETIGFARLCAWKHHQLHARATRYYQQAFDADPRLAEDLVLGDRYNAAGSAALAGCGRGRDAESLTPERRAALREQARRWLRADLELRARIIGGDDRAAADRSRALLRYWRDEPNFAGIRDAEALAGLPEDERHEWTALWDEVARLAAPPPGTP